MSKSCVPAGCNTENLEGMKKRTKAYAPALEPDTGGACWRRLAWKRGKCQMRLPCGRLQGRLQATDATAAQHQQPACSCLPSRLGRHEHQHRCQQCSTSSWTAPSELQITEWRRLALAIDGSRLRQDFSIKHRQLSDVGPSCCCQLS